MELRITFRVTLLCLLFLSAAGRTFPDDKSAKGDAGAPVEWGTLTQNTGCVIFHETKKTNGRFYGVAVTSRTFYVLDLIETQNYKLAQTHWTEDQDGMNELQRIAAADGVKFVKLPAKNYTPAQLSQARDMCAESQKQPTAATTSPKS